MTRHTDVSASTLRALIRVHGVRLGGNLKLKIYGRLDCESGKRMKRENRVFFATENEALENNFRPCGHCLREAYKKWKDEVVRPKN